MMQNITDWVAPFPCSQHSPPPLHNPPSPAPLPFLFLMCTRVTGNHHHHQHLESAFPFVSAWPLPCYFLNTRNLIRLHHVISSRNTSVSGPSTVVREAHLKFSPAHVTSSAPPRLLRHQYGNSLRILIFEFQVLVNEEFSCRHAVTKCGANTPGTRPHEYESYTKSCTKQRESCMKSCTKMLV